MWHLYRSLYNGAYRLRCALKAVVGDDRGEITSDMVWIGAMVIGAVSLAGILVAKSEAVANALDFGG